MLAAMSKHKPYCTDEKWPGRADCKHCAIRSTVLFSALNTAELDQVLLNIDNGWHETGFELFGQHDDPAYIYTVRAGCVKMEHTLDDGTTRIVRLHYRGDAIGLEALLGESYRHSAIVMQRADICRIPVGVIHKLKAHNAQLYEQLIQRWQVSLEEAECFITDLNTGHAESRLARLLLKLDLHGEQGSIPKLLREDIAAIIGVTTETASRLMADFRRRELVTDGENRSMRCNTAALRQLV